MFNSVIQLSVNPLLLSLIFLAYQNLTLSLVVDKLMWVSGTVALYDCRRSTRLSKKHSKFYVEYSCGLHIYIDIYIIIRKRRFFE